MTKSESLTRRHALRGAAVVGVGVPILAACGGSDDPAEGTETEAPDATSESPDSGTETQATEGGGDALASTSDIPEGGGAIFEEEGVVITQPAAGEFKAFDSICTHQGCPVSDVTDTINCTCHGSQFSITDGSVVTGPATAALAAKGITVDGDSITLT